MRRSLGFLMAGTLLVSACQVQLKELTPAKKSTTTVAKKDPKASPSPSPSASASTGVQPSASPSAPAEPTTLLKGLVKIDASYVIATGGGNVISTGGGNFISTNGGTVISTGGGNVIATGGGNVISVGGGNVISTGGGNVISTGGGNVISTGGGNYNLLQAAVAPGTLLPVEKMVVVPVSLLDDRQAGPAVYTNEKGEFSLNIPEYLQGKVRLYAAVPGKDANDPLLKNARHWYNLLASTKATTDLVIDEDTVKVSRLVRDTFRTKIVYYLNPSTYNPDEKDEVTSGDITINFEDDVPEFQRVAILATVKQLTDLLKKYNIQEDRVPELARRMADAMLARIDLTTIKITSQAAPKWTGPATEAVPFMVGLMREMRERCQEKLTAGTIKPDYPAGLKADIDAINVELQKDIDEDKAYNLEHPDAPKTLAKLRPQLADPTYRIERASDLTEFMVAEFFTSSAVAFRNGRIVVEDLLRDGEDGTVADGYMEKMSAAGTAVGFAFGIEFLKFQNETYTDADPEVKRRPELKGKNKLESLFEEFSRPAGS